MKTNNIFNALKVITLLSDAVAAAGQAVVYAVKTVVGSVKALFAKKEDSNDDSNATGGATPASSDNSNVGPTGTPSGGLGLGVMALLAMFGAGLILGMLMPSAGDGVAMAFAIVAGVVGKGEHVVDEPLTTDLADTASPGLLRNEIDDRIVKIRPMSTPLDQISRYGGARLCGSMKVDYYSVDTRPTEDVTTEAYISRGSTTGAQDLSVKTPQIFDPTTTILVPSVKSSSGGSLVLYVTDRNKDHITIVAVNNKNDSGENFVPNIPSGTKLIRMGRAAAELDVMTAQFEALPKKDTNYCQIFKAQVEQSTFMKIANKEVGWTFSDQEEAAIIDMRLGMEKNFLFGHKAIITDDNKGESILLTGGIWNQTDNTFEYESLSSEDALVALCKKAFTNNAGSSRKVLIGGTGLIEQLHKIDHSRVLSADQTVTKWGLDFTEIHSKFGTLYVLLSEVFDQCGMPDGGMVIDPEYITKYSHVPFRTERLNLRSAGVRNTDAIVITEASCLVLRYPGSHMRIVRVSE
jgi:hypothetical protein